jgi:hypothetical protein
MKTSGSSFWLRALLCWALIALVETVHGVLRAVFVVPALGETAAQRLGFGVGCALVLAVARLSRRWLGATTRRAQLQAGALWLACMLGFELLVGRARGFDWSRIGAEFDPAQGGLMGVGLLLMLLAPMIGAWGSAPPQR